MYDFLECRGCGCVTLRCTTTCERLFGEEKLTRYFPPSSARRWPVWAELIPLPANNLLHEVYNALHYEGLRLAVMGARTLVDMAVIEKVGDVGTFPQKLTKLEEQGFIGARNREVLTAALDAGNATSHRGHKFKSQEVHQVMDIVENLLQAIYVLESAAQKLKTATPPRKKTAK
jgi:hypothetical protein